MAAASYSPWNWALPMPDSASFPGQSKMKICIAFPVVVLVSFLAPDLVAAQTTSGISFCAAGPPCIHTDAGSGTTSAQITFSGQPQNETILVVDPSNPLIIVAGFNDYRLGTGFAGQGVAVSNDAGATWTDLGVAIPQPAGFATRGGDPGLAFDSQGRVYYSFIAGGGSGTDGPLNRDNGVFIASSVDGGNTWSPAVTVASNTAAPLALRPFEDKPFIAADEYPGSPFTDRVYMSWTTFYHGDHPNDSVLGGGDIMFSFSSDNGATWSVPQSLTAGPGNGGTGELRLTFVHGSEPEVAPNHDVYVSYFARGRVEVVRSTDGGVSFGLPTHPFSAVEGSASVNSPLPDETFRVNAFPNIETDPIRPGNVYVVGVKDPDGVFDGDRDGGDIIFARSTDDGAHWDPLLTLNDDGVGSNQFFPWMAVDPVTGHVCVIWYDTRNDVDNHKLDVYGTFSFDGGQIFSSNIRLTTVNFDPDTGQFNDPVTGDTNIFIGDYNGLAAGANIFHALWTDTSTGEQEIAHASKDAGGPLDIFLLADSSTTFEDDLVSFQAQASAVIDSLLLTNPDTRFGLGRYGDYPIAPFGDPDDSAYQLTEALTFDSKQVLSAIARIGDPDTLYAGTDVEDFALILPDKLGVIHVDGSTVLDTSIVETTFHFNGLATTGTGSLFAGEPSSSLHIRMTVGGSLISSVIGPLDADCCNEDIAFDGTHVWRADWSEGPLMKFLPNGMLVASFNQTDVVGAAFVGETLWLTKWAARQVGEFDPLTDTFTPRFSTSTNAGALAYDSGNSILWVGQQGGMISAWDLSTPTPTAIAGSAIQPFGSISETVDGLAFIPTFGGGGGDVAQSQLVALLQAGTGDGQTVTGFPQANIPAGQKVNFREDALQLYLLWSNAPFHVEGDTDVTGLIEYPGPTFAAAVSALGGAKVAGISSGGGGLSDLSTMSRSTGALAPPGGVDCDGDGIVDIFEGEPLVCIGEGEIGAEIGVNIIAIVEGALKLSGLEAAVDDLEAEVLALSLSKGLEKSFVGKLTLVGKKIRRGQSHVAINVLNAFINHAEAKAAGEITPADAANLIVKAQLIIDDLQSN